MTQQHAHQQRAAPRGRARRICSRVPALLPTAVLWSAGCAAAPVWDGGTQQWGTMASVLAEGRVHGRVGLEQLADAPGVVAVGALEDLAGEVTIADGRLWIARAGAGDEPQINHHAGAELRATLLTAARVPRWRKHVFSRALSERDLEEAIRNAASEHGLDTGRPFPFLLDGRFTTCAAHVINGRCAHQAGLADAFSAPLHFAADGRRGTVVGFYAENAAGRLTHHGSNMHAHVIVRDQPSLSGHADRLALEPGAVLRLPVVGEGSKGLKG